MASSSFYDKCLERYFQAPSPQSHFWEPSAIRTQVKPDKVGAVKHACGADLLCSRLWNAFIYEWVTWLLHTWKSNMRKVFNVFYPFMWPSHWNRDRLTLVTWQQFTSNLRICSSCGRLLYMCDGLGTVAALFLAVTILSPLLCKVHLGYFHVIFLLKSTGHVLPNYTRFIRIGFWKKYVYVFVSF